LYFTVVELTPQRREAAVEQVAMSCSLPVIQVPASDVFPTIRPKKERAPMHFRSWSVPFSGLTAFFGLFLQTPAEVRGLPPFPYVVSGKRSEGSIRVRETAQWMIQQLHVKINRPCTAFFLDSLRSSQEKERRERAFPSANEKEA
jgi:hypothetical protein